MTIENSVVNWTSISLPPSDRKQEREKKKKTMLALGSLEGMASEHNSLFALDFTEAVTPHKHLHKSGPVNILAWRESHEDPHLPENL